MNTQDIIDGNESCPNPGPGAKAFADVLPKLLAYQDEPVLIRTGLGRAVHIALATAERIEPLLPTIFASGAFDNEKIASLRTCAWACHHADLVWQRRSTPPAMAAEGAKLRRTLLNGLEPFVDHGLVSRERVDGVPRGIAHTELADGLLELAELYSEIWPSVSGKTPITIESVQRAGELGGELHLRVANKGEDEPEESGLSRREARERAWSLLYWAYEEVDRAVTWLRWYEGDANELVPTLYPKARRQDEEADEAEPAPAPTSEGQPA